METQNVFNGKDLFIGIDVHKKSWHICISGKHSNFKPFSIDPDPLILSKYLHKNFPGANYKAAYEAGFCGFQPCKSLKALGIDCIVVHPSDIPTTDKEKKRKTDPVDCKKIARALRAGQLTGIDIPSDRQLHDRSLLRCREQFIQNRTRCKNRIKGYLYYHMIQPPEELQASWSNRYVSWLEKVSAHHPALQVLLDHYKDINHKVKELTKKLKQLSKTDRYGENTELLRSVPGIGPLTAITLAIALGDICRFPTFDRLASYIGLIPNVHHSGETERTGKITSRGNKLIKKYLIEASWILIGHDPEMMARFNALAGRMSKNRAIIRIAKSLLSRIKAVLDKKEPYKTNYKLAQAC